MKKLLFLASVLLLAVCVCPPACYANAGPPPSILIIVPGAPDDLDIVIEPGETTVSRTDKVLESYFAFYIPNLKSTDYNLKITTGGAAFEVMLHAPFRYDNTFTLDLKNRTLTPGKSFSRFFNLISLRIVLTLLIEGLIFYLFGFRRKRSWLVFLIVNLITQGALNVWLGVSTTPLQYYIILNLILGEILVFIIEMAAFLIFVRERRPLIAVFVITANAASLFAGGWLISQLPV